MLNTKETVYFECDSHEFDRWTEEYFGKRYDYMAEQEAYEQSDSYRVTGQSGSYATERVEAWIGNDEHEWYGFMAGELLNYACLKGDIPPGNYLIHVGDG